MKILVVDDEVVGRKKLIYFLRQFGECDAAESSTIAIQKVAEALGLGTPYDLITLDIVMPEIDGFRILIKIREMEKLHFEKTARPPRKSKIMMVTSRSDKNLIVGCMKAGADNYLVKPSDRETIVEKLRAMGFTVE